MEKYGVFEAEQAGFVPDLSWLTISEFEAGNGDSKLVVDSVFDFGRSKGEVRTHSETSSTKVGGESGIGFLVSIVFGLENPRLF